MVTRWGEGYKISLDLAAPVGEQQHWLRRLKRAGFKLFQQKTWMLLPQGWGVNELFGFAPVPNTMHLSCSGSTSTFEMNVRGWALLLFALVPSVCAEGRYWAPVTAVRIPNCTGKRRGKRARLQAPALPFPRTAVVPMQPLPSCWERKSVGWAVGSRARGLSDEALASSQHTERLSEGRMVVCSAGAEEGGLPGRRGTLSAKTPKSASCSHLPNFLPQPALGVNLDGRKKTPTDGGERFWHWEEKLCKCWNSLWTEKLSPGKGDGRLQSY